MFFSDIMFLIVYIFRPPSLGQLRGFEIENEKCMQNDVLTIRKPLTSKTPLRKESIASSLSQNSTVLRASPVASSVQIENDLTVTPSPSTSKIRYLYNVHLLCHYSKNIIITVKATNKTIITRILHSQFSYHNKSGYYFIKLKQKI